jgi:hypothetical protein
MANYDKIINIISIILILLILFVILFGCQYQKNNYYERFENSEDNKKEKETKKEEEKPKEEEKSSLSPFEQSVLKGLTDGSLKTESLSSLIKEEKFTEKNLNNLIQHVEMFKGAI